MWAIVALPLMLSLAAGEAGSGQLHASPSGNALAEELCASEEVPQAFVGACEQWSLGSSRPRSRRAGGPGGGPGGGPPDWAQQPVLPEEELLREYSGCPQICVFRGLSQDGAGRGIVNCTLTDVQEMSLMSYLAENCTKSYAALLKSANVTAASILIRSTSPSGLLFNMSLADFFEHGLANVKTLSLDGAEFNLQSANIVSAFPSLSSLTWSQPKLNLQARTLRWIPPDLKELTLQADEILLPTSSPWAVGNGNSAPLEILKIIGPISTPLSADALSAMQSLRSLTLSGNGIQMLPSRLFQGLSQLTHLNLADNLLAVLQADLFLGSQEEASLSQLRSLDLSQNILTSLESGTLDNLVHLTTLDLSGNNIASLQPSWFGRLTSMQTLDLSGNLISRLPVGAFQAMTLLAVLRASNNAIQLVDEDALAPLAALSALHLANNRLSSLPSRLLRGCPRLTSLDASQNFLETLPASIFTEQRVLASLSLARNSLADLSATLFSTLTGLRILDLEANALTQIDSQVFRALSSLERLDLSANALCSVAPGAFDALKGLRTLGLDGNRIRSLPQGIFDTLTSIETLDLSHNLIAALPSGDLFKSCVRLTALDLSRNLLTVLPATIFSSLTTVDQLSIASNKLTFLQEVLFDNAHVLTNLSIANNSISVILPQTFAALRILETLDLSRNQLTSIPPDLFAHQTLLLMLTLSRNKLSSLPLGVFRNQALLMELFVSRNHIQQIDGGLCAATPLLKKLSMSWNTVSSLPDELFEPLAFLSQLQLASMRLTSLPATLSTLEQLEYLDVANNSLLELPDLPRSLRFMNVSANPRFTVTQRVLSMVNLNILDVSGSLIPINPPYCDWGVSDRMNLIQAQSLHPLTTPDEMFFSGISRFISSCLSRVDLLDVSENNIEDLGFLRDTVSEVSFILQLSDDDTDGNSIITQLQVGARNPVQCVLQREDAPRTFQDKLQTLPTLVYSCSCNEGFHERGPHCVAIPPYWSTWKVVLLVLGMMLLSFLLAFSGRLFVKRHRKVRADLELKELLLTESESEVRALRRAWEVDPSELRLDARVDGDSPGAFGEVWRAQWENLTVAVKILREAAMTLDEEAQEEFHREVEFMQRTRHPNIVRFFGMGQWHNGAPFFVVELVSKGSLKAFLRTREGEAARSDVPWSLKVSLALDIAKGMEYLHDLGRMHRDLKSGNVLITEQNRAKVADFGTVRLQGHVRHTQQQQQQQQQRGRAAGKGSRPHSQEDGAVHLLELTAGKGTPLYMSPEVLRGRHYDQSADVWSYGVVLWELASQRSPDLLEQEGRTRGPMMGNLLDLLTEGKRLKLSPDWPLWWRSLIELCWIEQPNERPGFDEMVFSLGLKEGSAGDVVKSSRS